MTKASMNNQFFRLFRKQRKGLFLGSTIYKETHLKIALLESGIRTAPFVQVDEDIWL